MRREKKQLFKDGQRRDLYRINRDTSIHEEVLGNLNSIHGALLRMNRSIQSEGASGEIKWNRSYTETRRRGLDGLIFEISLIACGFNLHKFHLKKTAQKTAAYFLNILSFFKSKIRFYFRLCLLYPKVKKILFFLFTNKKYPRYRKILVSRISLGNFFTAPNFTNI